MSDDNVFTYEGPRPDVDWHHRVTKIIKSFRGGSVGRSSVYIALLRDVESSGNFGVYVGMTGKTPAERYHEHKQGYKAAKGWVKKYGICLLKTPHLWNIENEDAVRIERELAETLQRAGILTKGGH